MQAKFSSRISSIDQHYIFDPLTDAQSVFAEASEDARRRAQELAELTGSGDISLAPGSSSLPRLYLGEVARQEPLPDLNRGQLQILTPIRLPQTTIAPTPVKAVVEEKFTGAHPAELHKNSSIVGNAVADLEPSDSWSLAPMDPQAVIAADRPEIYVTETVSIKAALGRGLPPYLVAALNAREQARHWSKFLAVRPGPESLFALYPTDDGSDLRTLGLATTFSGDARWLETAPADAGVKAYRVDDPHQRGMVPIAVPDSGTTITEMAGAVPAQPPDAVRLDVEFAWDTPELAHAPGISAPSVVARLKRLPHVLDATSGLEPFDFGWRYSVLLRGSDPSTLTRTFEALRSVYARFQPLVKFRVDAVSLNCPALVDRLRKASFRQSWVLALIDSRRTHRPLRKLLLVTIFPIGRPDSCVTRATDPTWFDHRWPSDQPEVPQHVNLFPTSMMVFRTFASKDIGRRAPGRRGGLNLGDLGLRQRGGEEGAGTFGFESNPR